MLCLYCLCGMILEGCSVTWHHSRVVPSLLHVQKLLKCAFRFIWPISCGKLYDCLVSPTSCLWVDHLLGEGGAGQGWWRELVLCTHVSEQHCTSA